MIAAIPASIALGLVIMYPLMLVIAATVGYGLFSIVHRLRTGRWPKGRQARPQPEKGLSERERLAFYAVKSNAQHNGCAMRSTGNSDGCPAMEYTARSLHQTSSGRAVAALHAKHSEGLTAVERAYFEALSRGHIAPDKEEVESMTTEPTDLMNELNHLTIQDLQLLTLIGQGVDNRPELVKASGFTERTVFRRVDIFERSLGTWTPASSPVLLCHWC